MDTSNIIMLAIKQLKSELKDAQDALYSQLPHCDLDGECKEREKQIIIYKDLLSKYELLKQKLLE